METIGIGSVVGWSLFVGVMIGLFLSELLRRVDKHTEDDHDLEELAVPDRPLSDDGVVGISARDALHASDCCERGTSNPSEKER